MITNPELRAQRPAPHNPTVPIIDHRDPLPTHEKTKETTMSTNLKLKLVALLITIAIFALPIVDPLAGGNLH